MIYVVLLLSVSAVIEFTMHALRPRHPALRNMMAGSNIVVIAATATLLSCYAIGVFTCLLLIVSAYRILNSLRIIRARMHYVYLWSVTFRTSLWLILIQAGIVMLWGAWAWIADFSSQLFLGVLALQIVATALALNSFSRKTKTAASLKASALAAIDLPTLTVAIPARNETDDLDACIAALLASNYPKLEILVLDDCSQTTRTPEIIRSFAHEGVRFIQGEEPASSWLAKNQAYDALAKTANGKYLLFMGVDIRVEPTTLRQLMKYAIEKQKSMVCVMPLNRVGLWAVPLLQPMRYVWELALPRRQFGHPPVLSSFWLITRQALQDAGGFRAASRMIVPEAYFAERTRQNDGYSFLAAGKTLGVTSFKSIAEQRDTAIRVTYPQLHKRPELVLILTFVFISWIVAPLLTLVSSVLFGGVPAQRILAITLILLSMLAYSRLLKLGYDRSNILEILSLPLASLLYVGLVNYSMYRYEFSEVIWKGRNVCLPVMHVVPHLPPV